MAFCDHNLATLADYLKNAGFNPAHARRLLRDFYDSHGRQDLTKLSIGNALRNFLLNDGPPRRSHVLQRAVSNDGTTKLLIGLDSPAGGSVEAVMMPAHKPQTAMGCVSSQIGCAMGCDFCASTRDGLERDLDASEIVEQFLHLREVAAEGGRQLKTVVFMGMGEPLLNLRNVLPAIERMCHEELGAIGWRHVTVSTVGIVPGMDALTEADLNVNLAVSLHAPDDATRSRIVPMNRRYRVADVMAATKRFADRTGRIPTIEYCLLKDVNDTPDHALMLVELMRGFRAHVNVIPYNPIGAGLSGTIYQRPEPQLMKRFLMILREQGVVAHARHIRGDDVNAACGQLRQSTLTSLTVGGAMNSAI